MGSSAFGGSGTTGSNPRNNSRNNSRNVVDLFSGKTYSTLERERIIRLSPEYDGLCMLYSTSKTFSEKLYTMKILCWGIRENGEVVALVPWLNGITPCDQLVDQDLGRFEGYYDISSERVFYAAPPHKIMELETAAEYFEGSAITSDTIVQEIPDAIGTHAMLNAEDDSSLIITEVISWRLMGDGRLQAMLIDEEAVQTTPILPGDDCLYPAEENGNFRYFFQHQIANQLKSEDPDALAAIALLFE